MCMTAGVDVKGRVAEAAATTASQRTCRYQCRPLSVSLNYQQLATTAFIMP